MNPALPVVLVASALLVFAGSLVVWRSRWNVPGVLDLGFATTLYAIPVLILGVQHSFPDSLVRTYTWIFALSALSYVAGLLIGARFPWRRLMSLRLTFTEMNEPEFTRLISRRVTLLLAFGVGGLLLSLLVLGFIPLFTPEPALAKFFRGPYEESYRRVAILLRGAFFVLAAAIPVGLAAWYTTRRKSFLFLSALGVVLLLGFLTRLYAGAALLLFLGLVAARRRRFVPFLMLALVAFPFASALWYLISHLFEGFNLFRSVPYDNAWEAVEAGAPDVRIHLQLLGQFLGHGEFTGGRTFWGGLVPWHYEWNPDVWAARLYFPGVDISTLSSGGFRLPLPLASYFAFGWFGVAWVSFLSGIVWGNATAFARRYVGKGTILRSAVVLTLYLTLGAQLARFWHLWLYSLPGIAAAIFLVSGYQRKQEPSRALTGRDPPVERPAAVPASI